MTALNCKTAESRFGWSFAVIKSSGNITSHWKSTNFCAGLALCAGLVQHSATSEVRQMRASVWALETFRGTNRLTVKGSGLFVCNLGRPNPHTLETGGFCFLESNFLHFFTRPRQTKKSGQELRWSRKIVSGCWWLIFGGWVPTFSFGMFSCTSLPPWQNLVLASSHSGVVFSGHTFAKHLQKTSLRMKSERSQHLM